MSEFTKCDKCKKEFFHTDEHMCETPKNESHPLDVSGGNLVNEPTTEELMKYPEIIFKPEDDVYSTYQMDEFVADYWPQSERYMLRSSGEKIKGWGFNSMLDVLKKLYREKVDVKTLRDSANEYLVGIYKPNDFYTSKKGELLKDGHTMMTYDIVSDLNNYRRGFLKLQSQLTQANKEIVQWKNYEIGTLNELAMKDAEIERLKKYNYECEEEIAEMGKATTEDGVIELQNNEIEELKAEIEHQKSLMELDEKRVEELLAEIERLKSEVL